MVLDYCCCFLHQQYLVFPERVFKELIVCNVFLVSLDLISMFLWLTSFLIEQQFPFMLGKHIVKTSLVLFWMNMFQ